MDGRQISNLDKKYDGIIAGFAFPYFNLQEVEKFIADATMLLQQNGYLYISTMEDTYESSRMVTNSKGDVMMMHFYTEQLLTEILHKHNFKIEYLHRFHTTMPNAMEVVDLVLVGRLAD